MSTLLQTGSPTQAARFEALLRASKAIASSGDCGNCEEVFARELRSAISFDYLHVSMFESDRGSSCNSGWRLFDIHGSKRQIPEADLPVDEIELMSSLVHEDGQPLVVADWSKEARFPHLKVFITGLGINSTCMLPLVRGQRRLGVFEVGNTQRNAYCNEEVAFLSFAADQVALSIDAAVNFAVSQQAQERLKLLLELTNQVVSNLELRKLLRAASASLRRVMNRYVGGVILPHPGGGPLQIYPLYFSGRQTGETPGRPLTRLPRLARAQLGLNFRQQPFQLPRNRGIDIDLRNLKRIDHQAGVAEACKPPDDITAEISGSGHLIEVPAPAMLLCKILTNEIPEPSQQPDPVFLSHHLQSFKCALQIPCVLHSVLEHLMRRLDPHLVDEVHQSRSEIRIKFLEGCPPLIKQRRVLVLHFALVHL